MGANNKAVLSGTVVSKPVMHHMFGNDTFYMVKVQSLRKSGTEDIIPVVYNKSTAIFDKIDIGDKIQVYGEYRSHNNHSKAAIVRKEMFLLSTEDIIFAELEHDQDEVEFYGTICNETIFRETPLHKEICDFVLAVLRDDGKSDYINCIAWKQNAREIGASEVGDKFSIKGRIQSREYVKKHDGIEETRTAYEVSAFQVKKVEVEE